MDTETLDQLKERAKELQCIYKVSELLKKNNQDLGKIFYELLGIIPHGWQDPGICFARIIFENQKFSVSGFTETKWKQVAEIIVDNNILGEIQVFYTNNIGNEYPFLPEEQKLLNTIANKTGNYIFNKRLTETIRYIENTSGEKGVNAKHLSSSHDEHWKWRMKMSRKIASKTDFKKFGIKAMYIIGSVKEATAGPVSDIDLLVHFIGTEKQKQLFASWIGGWSLALAEIVTQKTGYEYDNGIIDLHLITDEDIENKTCYAIMIESVNNSARLLK